MRLKEFYKALFGLLCLLGIMLGLLAWVSGQVKASPRQVVSNATQIYMPLILDDPSPTPPFTATSTSTFTPIPSPTFTSTDVPGCPAHHGAYELELYDLINQARADHGKPPLIPNGPLETSSGWHSDDMAKNHFISHTGSDNSTPCQRMQAAGWTTNWCAEVIMYAASPQAAMDWWMGEGPGGAHYDTILGNLTDFGAGYAYCTGESGGYYTVDFGHR